MNKLSDFIKGGVIFFDEEKREYIVEMRIPESSFCRVEKAWMLGQAADLWQRFVKDDMTKAAKAKMLIPSIFINKITK